jgi:lipopolysaccharide export system ATP-binding protein
LARPQRYSPEPGALRAVDLLLLLSMILRAEHLVKQYKARTVVNDMSLSVGQGEIVGLLGPNGAGKTTCFYMMVGMVKANSGRIFIDEEDITRLPIYQRARRGMGYLAQEASVFRDLSVEENILSVLEMTSMPKKAQHDKVEELLEEFSLGRRTEIARALAVSPKFVLLDEPFAGVDPIATEEIQGIVAKLKNQNIGVLITDHDVNSTLEIVDRAYLLFEGKLLKAGTAEELAADETVRRVYLGKNFEFKRKVFE